ncbi:MAG: ABC transporter substrate-binding protein [Proteobacteria bacterium]|nr:ABC transporter substrate-binding protein [Pseudomonadota bacterium]
MTPYRLTRRAMLIAGTAVLAAPYVARAASKSIVVATSGGALEASFDAAYYKPFTAKTGIEIVKTVNTYSKLKAMVEANAVEWDVAQLDSPAAANFAHQGLLEKLDYGVIDKTDLIEGAAQESYLRCDVAAACIAWNTKIVKPAQVPKTWAELWDLKRFSGQRGLWKQPYQTMELALMADGVPLDKLYPLDVDRALKSLDRIKQDIFWWANGAQSAQILIDGDVPAGMTWNGRVYDPRQNGAPVDFHFNQALFVADTFVVPRGAKNRKEAMEFIAFAMQPQPQADFSKTIPYGPTNRKALALLDEKRLAVLPSSTQNLAHGVFQNADWWAENGAKTLERFNSWILG